MMLPAQHLTIRGTVTNVGKVTSALPNCDSTEGQLMSIVSQIRHLVIFAWFFFCRVPLTVKSLGLPVVDISDKDIWSVVRLRFGPIATSLKQFGGLI